MKAKEANELTKHFHTKKNLLNTDFTSLLEIKEIIAARCRYCKFYVNIPILSEQTHIDNAKKMELTLTKLGYATSVYSSSKNAAKQYLYICWADFCWSDTDPD